MAGVGILSIGVVAAGATHVLTARNAADAAVNPNCTLIVPANPLTAQGLATAYQLTATNPADGPCNEANAGQTAFVQGAVIDPATGQISVYNPLVVDAGTQPAATPVVPALPAGGVVALWFGFNGNTLTLAGADQAGTATATAASATATATPVAVATATGSPTLTGSPAAPSTAAAATATVPAATGTTPPATANVPAASGTPDAILQQSNCIAGESIAGVFSPFTQVAACNAVAFFQAANTAIQAGTLTVPSPGTAKDGQPCLTTRNFALIDQDQSDNVVSAYLMDANGNTAQNTAANKAAMAGATMVSNGSDDGLLVHFIDPALGCKAFTATDPTSANGADGSEALNALSARMNQRGTQALLPVNDPQLLVAGQFSIGKTNTFRMMNDQPLLSPFTNKNQDAATYCQNMVNVQAPKLQLDAATEANFTTPVPAVGNNLATFMGARLSGSFANMNCQNFGLKDPTTVTTDGNGVATAVTYNVTPQKATRQGGGNGTTRGRHHNPIYFFFGRSGHKENGAGM